MNAIGARQVTTVAIRRCAFRQSARPSPFVPRHFDSSLRQQLLNELTERGKGVSSKQRHGRLKVEVCQSIEGGHRIWHNSQTARGLSQRAGVGTKSERDACPATAVIPARSGLKTFYDGRKTDAAMQIEAAATEGPVALRKICAARAKFQKK